MDSSHLSFLITAHNYSYIGLVMYATSVTVCRPVHPVLFLSLSLPLLTDKHLVSYDSSVMEQPNILTDLYLVHELAMLVHFSGACYCGLVM